MKNLVLFFSIAVIALLLISCEAEDRGYLPSYSGSGGELIVVCSNPLWNGPFGDSIQAVFRTPVYGLPQDEPQFDLVHTTAPDFKRIFKTFRNVIYVDLDSTRMTKPEAQMKRNVWAQQQLVFFLKASESKELFKSISEEGYKMSEAFNTMELNRLYARNKRMGEKKIGKKIKENLGYEIITQQDAFLVNDTSSSIWLRIEREKPKGGFQHQISQGILLNVLPYVDRSQFLDSNILVLRDSLMKANLPGPSEGSYITTEYKYIPPKIEEINFNGHYGVEIRNLWRMENNFMGGPMISYFILDEERDNIIALTGYVYCPQFDKREFLREVQAIMRSVVIPEPA
jgi:hypothetical protein